MACFRSRRAASIPATLSSIPEAIRLNPGITAWIPRRSRSTSEMPVSMIKATAAKSTSTMPPPTMLKYREICSPISLPSSPPPETVAPRRL